MGPPVAGNWETMDSPSPMCSVNSSGHELYSSIHQVSIVTLLPVIRVNFIQTLRSRDGSVGPMSWYQEHFTEKS